MKGGLGNIMKQAQKMQENLQKAQAEIAAMEIGGESGGGLVKVTITGRYEVQRISIDDSLVGDDKDMLEDLVAAAFNDAVRKVERHHAGENGWVDLRHGFTARDAGRFQNAILIDRHGRFAVAKPVDDGAALSARRRAKIGAADGLACAGTEPRRWATAGGGFAGGAGGHWSLSELPRFERDRVLSGLRQSASGSVVALRD